MHMPLDIWAQVSELAEYIELQLNNTGTKIDMPSSEYSWHNSIFTSNKYRRAHIEIVDNRDSHKLYILHCTIFPCLNDPSPIWGFDIICGPNKITGSFLDFSSTGNSNHPMMQWFKNITWSTTWNKPRTLPAWAQAIFSDHMIAAGNISTKDELDALITLAKSSLDYYLANVGNTRDELADIKFGQNKYCIFQKQNPHVVRSMVSMGVPEQVINQFVNDILFPEVD
jgi:Ferredoxin-dependent bilin reductase